MYDATPNSNTNYNWPFNELTARRQAVSMSGAPPIALLHAACVLNATGVQCQIEKEELSRDDEK